MANNKNHPKTEAVVEMLRERFCDIHVTPIGETLFVLKSDSAHHTKLLFNKITEELNKAYENE